MLEEFLLVLAYSKRTQVALALALVVPVLVWLLGLHMVGRIEFVGPLAPLTEFVHEHLMHRYDNAALAALTSFLGAAVTCYRRDRKRLFRL
jgi:hypothetical protein